MPAEFATEENLNQRIRALTPEELKDLKARIDGRKQLEDLAAEVRVFQIMYGKLPSALEE